MARPRKKGDDDGDVAIGEVGEGREKAGCDGDRLADLSEFWERDRDEMGTVTLLMLELELRGFQSALRLFERDGSSGGISSGAGRGRPFTTATN